MLSFASTLWLQGFENQSHSRSNRKSDMPDTAWIQLSKELHESEYGGRVAVYTDGSVKDGRAACAVYSDEFKQLSQLRDRTSIFTAELKAILYAIMFIKNCPGKYIIYSDSTSSIIALQSVSTSTHQVMYKIYEVFMNMPDGKVKIEWVPSYTGIPGNDKADHVAGEALNLHDSQENSCTTEDAIRELRDIIRGEWNRDYSHGNFKLLKFRAEIGKLASSLLTRRQEVSINRLRLEASMLSHGHIFSKTIPPKCTVC